MSDKQTQKSTVAEIRARFDNDVERFSNLETGQSATLDAPLVLDLITQVAATHVPGDAKVLDIGCGAGNYTLQLLKRKPGSDCTLVDLSQPMLARAVERLLDSTEAQIKTYSTHCGDIREVPLRSDTYDIVMAAAVLHHLRDDADWEQTFGKIYRVMKPGGIFLVSDLMEQDVPAVRQVQWQRYGDYLRGLKDDNYRQTVFDYIEKEDTPRSLAYQLKLCREVGFQQVDVLHANTCFASYCAVK